MDLDSIAKQNKSMLKNNKPKQTYAYTIGTATRQNDNTLLLACKQKICTLYSTRYSKQAILIW